MKKTIERNEGKHARQGCTMTGKLHDIGEPFVHVVPTKEIATKAERRKTRFFLVESIRILVITLFLFAVQFGGQCFFPLVFLLIVSGLLSVLEYEADYME